MGRASYVENKQFISEHTGLHGMLFYYQMHISSLTILLKYKDVIYICGHHS